MVNNMGLILKDIVCYWVNSIWLFLTDFACYWVNSIWWTLTNFVCNLELKAKCMLFNGIFVSNTIAILVAIGTIIIALIAILAGIINYNMGRDAEVIKNHLEETSNLYISYKKDFNTVIENRYNIELFLTRYNNLYKHFFTQNENLIKLGKLYWTLIYCACWCFISAITLDLVYLYKISEEWSITLGISTIILLVFLWKKHKKKIFDRYLIPESYAIDFPSYEDLLTPNKNISVAGRKVVENLSAYLLRASSYIMIGEDIYGQEEQIKLYILKDFRMNATLTVEYKDGTNDIYDFDSTKISANEIDGYFYLFKLVGDKENISRITLEMPSDREGKEGTISFEFYKVDKADKADKADCFICTSFSESNSYTMPLPNYCIIKPHPKN